jgi:drug/metabolite transporter (DMT)-like permease
MLFALSNVLEQHEAEQVPDEHSLRVSLLRRLVARPLWLLGFVSDVGGFIVSAAALALGAVIFVQPILSLGLLMSLLLSSVLYHQRLLRHAWLAALVLCGGLALFLYEVSPTGGRDSVDIARMAAWGPVITVSIAACLLLARHVSKGARAALMGAAASISFAASAVFTKAFVHYLGQGVFAWVPHWEPYALGVTSIFGLVIVQSAFQVGSLPGAVGGIEATQPVAAVIVGVGLLDERVSTGSAGDLFTVVVAMVAIFVGAIVLANANSETSEDLPVVIDLRDSATTHPKHEAAHGSSEIRTRR